MSVPLNGSLEAARVLSEIGMVDRQRTRAALRSALIDQPEDYDTFDRLFPQFWQGVLADIERHQEDKSPPPEISDDSETISSSSAEKSTTGDDDDQVRSSKPIFSYSETEQNRSNDGYEANVAQPSRSDQSRQVIEAPTEEQNGCAATITSLIETLNGYRHRGRTPSKGGEFLDVRRALRESYQTGGTVPIPPKRSVKETAVRCTFLVDVSQSVLDVVDRDFLIKVLKKFHATCKSMRIFFFDTDLREVTDAIDERTVEDVYDALERAEAAWGGGTLIGKALTTVRTEYPHAIDRNTIVFIISDGLETGEVDQLEEGITWVSRRSQSIFWLNPLAVTPSYEPTCRGMAVSEPHVEGIFGFTSVDDLREMNRQLKQYTGTEPLGYQRATPNE